jgi:hypothetical protein
VPTVEQRLGRRPHPTAQGAISRSEYASAAQLPTQLDQHQHRLAQLLQNLMAVDNVKLPITEIKRVHITHDKLL